MRRSWRSAACHLQLFIEQLTVSPNPDKKNVFLIDTFTVSANLSDKCNAFPVTVSQ